MSAIGNKKLEPQANGRYNFAERSNNENSTCQNQVTKNNLDDKFRKPVDDVVMTVKNCMLDAILTAKDRVVISRVEMALGSITESSGQGPISLV